MNKKKAMKIIEQIVRDLWNTYDIKDLSEEDWKEIAESVVSELAEMAEMRQEQEARA